MRLPLVVYAIPVLFFHLADFPLIFDGLSEDMPAAQSRDFGPAPVRRREALGDHNGPYLLDEVLKHHKGLNLIGAEEEKDNVSRILSLRLVEAPHRLKALIEEDAAEDLRAFVELLQGSLVLGAGRGCEEECGDDGDTQAQSRQAKPSAVGHAGLAPARNARSIRPSRSPASGSASSFGA